MYTVQWFTHWRGFGQQILRCTPDGWSLLPYIKVLYIGRGWGKRVVRMGEIYIFTQEKGGDIKYIQWSPPCSI
jgi:hypothetical protein